MKMFHLLFIILGFSRLRENRTNQWGKFSPFLSHTGGKKYFGVKQIQPKSKIWSIFLQFFILAWYTFLKRFVIFTQKYHPQPPLSLFFFLISGMEHGFPFSPAILTPLRLTSPGFRPRIRRLHSVVCAKKTIGYQILSNCTDLRNNFITL